MSMQFELLVVTPVLNGCDSISRTLESVFIAAKTSKNVQVFHYIADANSTDGTSEIIAEFKAKNNLSNYIIQHVKESDNGIYDAISKGFRQSLQHEVDVYCYLNSGDYYSPYVFNILKEYFSSGMNWLTGLNVTYNEKGELISTNLPFNYTNDIITRGYFGTYLPFIQQESTFWSKEAMRSLDLDALSKFKLAGDFFIWHTFAKKKMKLNIVNVWLSGFSVMRGQLSEKHFAEYRVEFESIRDSRNPFDWVKVMFFIICWYLPSKYKIKLNKSIISR